MISYTLTSKHRIHISILLVLFSLISINIAIAIYVDNKTGQSYFIGSKFSKIKHFSLNNPQRKDVVFVGDSNTVFHIATNTFKENNLDVYNLGMSGVHYQDYPSHLDYLSSIKNKPKKIIISFSVNELYKELPVAHLPTTSELKLYYDIDKSKFIQSFTNWINSFNLFFTYSKAIYYKFESIYSNFNLHKSNVNKTNNHAEILNIDYKSIAKCNVFDVKQKNHVTILKCTNGDGILVNTVLEKSLNSKVTLGEMNIDTIKYINSMVALIDKNIDVIIILSPKNVTINYEYSINDITSAFDRAEIIDLTNYHIPNEMRADPGHFNHIGRIKYSEHLVSILAESNKTQP